MTTATYTRHAGKTGRPLGIFDVLSTVVETAIAAIRPSKTERPSQAVLEAAAARRLASRHQRQSPGFAADLFAAADRHERDAAN